MARPLTKKTADGELYTRPIDVEQQIDEALSLPSTELRERLKNLDRNCSSYLRSECLVHLIRVAIQTDNESLTNLVLPVLFSRCEAILLAKMPDSNTLDATLLREEALEKLTDLFVADGTGDIKSELDFYECRFNRAFRALRVDVVRRHERLSKRGNTTPNLPQVHTEMDGGFTQDVFDMVSDAFNGHSMLESTLLREELNSAIRDLPADERDAVVLVHGLGYKVESVDPDEATAATWCNCTGRTIRNRLSSAATKLARFKEEI